MSPASPAPAIRLHLLPEALDHAGEPRAALVVPPTPSRYDRRSITLLYPTVAAALAAKRAMEGAISLPTNQGRRS